MGRRLTEKTRDVADELTLLLLPRHWTRMKTLTHLGCNTCMAIALTACGADPVILGELIAAAESGDTESGAENDDTESEGAASDPADSGDGTDPSPGDEEPQDPQQPEDPEEPREPADPKEVLVTDILRVNCGNCHIGTGAVAFDYVHDIDLLIENGLIIPGSKEDSRLWQRMDNETMPPILVTQQRPTRGQIEIVGQFIDELE